MLTAAFLTASLLMQGTPTAVDLEPAFGNTLCRPIRTDEPRGCGCSPRDASKAGDGVGV